MTNDNNRATRVLVVEDFEPFRQFFRSTLSKIPRVQIIGEVSDGLDAVLKAEELQPDLILLDIGLPTLDGIEAARQIRALCPASRVIFLTQESGEHFVQEAFRVGAMAYVAKMRAGKELAAAVDAVLDGRQFVGSALSEQAQMVSSG
jgi:DNA-binding NarL/FixJ family response regulator